MIGNTGSMNFGDYYTKSETDGLLTPINSAVTALQTGKQDVITGTQLDALNSGINSTKVTTYDGYQTQINARSIDVGLITDFAAGFTNDGRYLANRTYTGSFNTSTPNAPTTGLGNVLFKVNSTATS
jgi:hypothetical protein